MTHRNLLFILTDQQRFDTLRYYGNEHIHMPHLNRLAEKSVVFQSAYVTQPVCTPSRASILSGLYPHNHKCIENNKPIGPDIPILPEMVSSDYKKTYIGKWHLGDEIIRQKGFDEWVSVEDIYRPYYSQESHLDQYSDYYHFLKSHGFLPDIEEDEHAYFSREFSTRLPEQYSKPAFMAQETDRFLQKNKNNPFIGYVSFLEPHPPYYSAYDEMYDPNEIVLPPTFYEEVSAGTPIKYKYSRKYYEEVGRHFPMKDEKTWRKLIARYWGALSLIDKYVGKILDSLKRHGLEDNTIVVFTSDHGDMMGDFRMLQKYVMYEPSVRVPLMIRVPGLRPSVIKEPISQVDLVPTLLELLNQSSVSEMDGKSLLPYIEGKSSLESNDVFIEWNGDEGENLWFTTDHNGEDKEKIDKVYGSAVRTVVTTDGWKLSLTEAAENELYNLNDDPYELTNLYDDDHYSGKVKELYDKIVRWQQQTNDHALLKKKLYK